MKNYELHEFNRDKVFTTEINVRRVVQSKFNQYETNSKGVTVIDKNKDLSNNRNLINLHTTKMSTIKFNQIIDINFEDFTDTGYIN